MNKEAGGSRRLAWVLLLACALVAFAPTYSWCSPEYRAVTILHTNDTHGHLLPFSFPEPPGPDADYAAMPAIKDIGGIARRATLVQRIESEMSGNVLFLDAGDVLDGTVLSIEYMGEADFAAMSAAGYDAVTPGNHEFSASLDEFRRNIRIASFPIVSANIVDRKSGSLALPSYKIFDFRGAKIAVFGLTEPSPDYSAAKEGFDFLDPVKAAKELVPSLRKQADIVVALTHLGIEQDKKLAREAPGIDVIVGGHSHTRLVTPILVRQTDQPQAFWIGGTIIAQDYWWGGELGRLDLRLRRDGGPFTLMSYSGRLIPVTSDIPEDPATARAVDKYYRPISKYYDQVIGEATATFYNEGKSENSILNLVCDAMREAGGVQVAIYNRGGVRGDMLRGPIRVWDVAAVLPFRNKLVEIEVTGKRLKQALAEGKPGVSGMRYRIVGGKVVEAVVGGQPLDDDAVYKIATVDFLLKNLFRGVTAGRVINENYREPVISYIKARKIISPVIDGRIKIK